MKLWYLIFGVCIRDWYRVLQSRCDLGTRCVECCGLYLPSRPNDIFIMSHLSIISLSIVRPARILSPFLPNSDLGFQDSCFVLLRLKLFLQVLDHCILLLCCFRTRFSLELLAQRSQDALNLGSWRRHCDGVGVHVVVRRVKPSTLSDFYQTLLASERSMVSMR